MEVNIPKRKLIICDIDGTILVNDTPFKGAVETVNMLSQKHDLVLITNNTTRSPQQILSRLLQLGFEINPNNIHTPILATIDHLKELGHTSGVLVVGEEIMIRLFNREGIKTVKKGSRALVVVASFDRTLDYAKLSEAHYAVSAGAYYVATHSDRFYPTETYGIPDAGAVIGAIYGSTERKPSEIIGKPSKRFINDLLRKHGAGPDNAMIIGDRLDTDIIMGNQAGITTVLTMTGAHKNDDISLSKIKPSHIVKSINEVIGLLNNDNIAL